MRKEIEEGKKKRKEKKRRNNIFFPKGNTLPAPSWRGRLRLASPPAALQVACKNPFEQAQVAGELLCSWSSLLLLVGLGLRRCRRRFRRLCRRRRRIPPRKASTLPPRRCAGQRWRWKHFDRAAQSDEGAGLAAGFPSLDCHPILSNSGPPRR